MIIHDKEQMEAFKWYVEFKKNCKCILCGSKKKVELHHIYPKGDPEGRGNKWDTVYAMIKNNMPLDDIKDEVNKTVPLCKKHHKAYHKKLGY